MAVADTLNKGSGRFRFGTLPANDFSWATLAAFAAVAAMSAQAIAFYQQWPKVVAWLGF